MNTMLISKAFYNAVGITFCLPLCLKLQLSPIQSGSQFKPCHLGDTTCGLGFPKQLLTLSCYKQLSLVLASLELKVILLPQSSKHWDYT